MLKHIPFYASLLGRELATGKSGVSHVLVYGAIEAHSLGSKGCIASNRLIATETGLAQSTVNNAMSILRKSGWIEYKLDTNNHRGPVSPLLEITTPLTSGSNPPLLGEVTPLTSPSNIEDSLDNKIEINNNYDENKVTNKISANNTTSSPDDTETIDLSIPLTVKALYYRVLKLYPGMPIINHNHINAWARALEAIPGALEYLQNLIDIDYPNYRNDADYKPSISSPKDIVDKKIKIENWLSNVGKAENNKARDLYLRTL